MNLNDPVWRGDYGIGPAGWDALIEEAVALDQPDHTPQRLAETLLIPDDIFQFRRYLDMPGMPSGVPDREQTRKAARHLMGWVTRQPERRESTLWRCLALMRDLAYPRDASPEHPDEVQQHLANHEHALTLVTEGDDPIFRILVLLNASFVARDAHQLDLSLDWAAEAQGVLARAALPTGAAPTPALAVAVGNPGWLPSQGDTLSILQVAAHGRAAGAARMMLDYDRAGTERDLQILAAERITHIEPVALVNALGQRATVYRDIGDVAGMMTLYEQQREFCEQHPSPRVKRRYLMSRHNLARHLEDWDSAQSTRAARAMSQIAEVLEIPPGTDLTPELVMDALSVLHAASDKEGQTGLGNDAHELAILLIDSGQAYVDPAALNEARRWLDVARTAWTPFGLNGLNAVAFRALMLDAIEGTAGDPQDLGRTMLEYVRTWRRPLGRRRALMEAVRRGQPGDQQILDALLDMRRQGHPVDAAFADLGIARWYLRAGDAASGDGETDAATAAWNQAVAYSEAAASGLSRQRSHGGPPQPLSVMHFIEALQIQATSLRRLQRPEDELVARVRSLPAIAQRFASAGTRQQRATNNTLYAAYLAETAILAAQLRDACAADAVAEVARRDRTGTILEALTHDPEVPQQIADLARQLVATLSVKISDDEPASGEGPNHDSTMRASVIDVQLTRALDVAGNIIGPMARTLFDPRTVLTPNCQDVLNGLHPGGPAAVLSLWLTSHDGRALLLRRLCLRAGPDSPVIEDIDIIEAPEWLPGLSAPDDEDLFLARLDQLAAILVPGTLREALLAADPDHPIALTLIPSGLQGIPFAALPISSQHLLLDLATINTLQSLQTALTLGATTPANPDPTPIDLAIYDFDHLRHTSHEYAALKKHRPETKLVTTLGALQEATDNPLLRSHHGLLALAIHGNPGHDGWSQTKQLPNGESLTAGHILQWYVPRLVVAGSCNTSIRSDDDGELGGFPLAFQLRGATAIIGTLYDVEDEATAQIMGLFYAAIAAGHAPAAALREAQRSWISQDRSERLIQTPRWAYLLTYGTPT